MYLKKDERRLGQLLGFVKIKQQRKGMATLLIREYEYIHCGANAPTFWWDDE